MRAARAKMSRHADVAKAMDYMLKHWDTFSRFNTDGRICLTNNAAERALRGVALGRKSWLFCGSDRGGDRAAAMYSLIVTAKLNDTRSGLRTPREQGRKPTPAFRRGRPAACVASSGLVGRSSILSGQAKSADDQMPQLALA